MRREYLGDSLDHPKRTIIAACVDCNEQEIRVLPMVTDDPTWHAADPAWTAYAWLLGLGSTSLPTTGSILNKGVEFTFRRDKSLTLRQQRAKWLTQRAVYFNAAAEYCGDLLLDPDTGLGFPRAEAAHREGRPLREDHAFIYRCELETMTNGTDRLLVIYQHKHRGNPEGYIAACKDLLAESNLVSFGYMLSHISLLFVSRSGDRLRVLRRYLESKLAGAPQRIR